MLNFTPPTLQFFADLSVHVDRPQEVGATVHGQRRVIPILGGEVQGQGWSARVLPGGADFQLILNCAKPGRAHRRPRGHGAADSRRTGGPGGSVFPLQPQF